ncbi:MAG: hypothetical protein L3J28_03970 [Candidatus Polarisedimenticolaceae bacterium]|nr:hypothetical protein [Candidatus Polarisedimenticolaceae bacterium]
MAMKQGEMLTCPRNLVVFSILLMGSILSSCALAKEIAQGLDDKHSLVSEKSAKRAGPIPVAPVTISDLRIEVVHWAQDIELGQNGGYLAAYDQTSGKQRWLLQVYCTDYDPRRERDTQDVFITRVQLLSNGSLAVVDELGREFLVNPVTRDVHHR